MTALLCVTNMEELLSGHVELRDELPVGRPKGRHRQEVMSLLWSEAPVPDERLEQQRQLTISEVDLPPSVRNIFFNCVSFSPQKSSLIQFDEPEHLRH